MKGYPKTSYETNNKHHRQKVVGPGVSYEDFLLFAFDVFERFQRKYPKGVPVVAQKYHVGRKRADMSRIGVEKMSKKSQMKGIRFW